MTTDPASIVRQPEGAPAGAGGQFASRGRRPGTSALAAPIDDEPWGRWCDVPLSFPNGAPDRFIEGDDGCWFDGCVVTVNNNDGSDQSLLVEGEALQGDTFGIRGKRFDDDQDVLTEEDVFVPIDSKVTLLEIP